MWPGAFSLFVMPHTAADRSASPQRVPSGLLTRSYTSAAGKPQLLRDAPNGAVAPALLMTTVGMKLPGRLLLPNELYQPWQLLWSKWPLIAAFLALICGCVLPAINVVQSGPA